MTVHMYIYFSTHTLIELSKTNKHTHRNTLCASHRHAESRSTKAEITNGSSDKVQGRQTTTNSGQIDKKEKINMKELSQSHFNIVLRPLCVQVATKLLLQKKKKKNPF